MTLPRLVGILIGGAMLVAWFVLLRPVMLGGATTYANVSGTSMEPMFHTGDLVIARADDSYAVGDVVVFRVPDHSPGGGALVVHRIVGGDAIRGFVTRGDNRDRPDPWRPTGSDIAGRAWFHVPGAANPLGLVRQPLILAGILGIVVFAAVVGSWPSARKADDTGSP